MLSHLNLDLDHGRRPLMAKSSFCMGRWIIWCLRSMLSACTKQRSELGRGCKGGEQEVNRKGDYSG